MESSLRDVAKERMAAFNRTDFPTYGWMFIYALCEPDQDVIRYIGSTNDIVSRCRQHFNGTKSKKKAPAAEWISSLKQQGTLPRVFVLARIDTMQKHLPRYHQDIGIGFMEVCSIIWPWMVANLAEGALIEHVSSGKRWNNRSGGWTADLLNCHSVVAASKPDFGDAPKKRKPAVA